ncbi:MAG TPA: zinc-binding dehydrogenase [Pseudonocardiaceae bacterium]|nr:zinc-binding dehydrogenase [Pseudonocardiaceae bacterium]
MLPDRALTVGILADAAAGLTKPVVGQRFPLERAADAHAAMEARTTIGKTLLVVSGAGGATAASTGSAGDASSAHRA